MFNYRKAFTHECLLLHFQITLISMWCLIQTCETNECPVHLHLYLKLQRKHQETREGGELPTSHQVSPLQFKVSLVPSLHYHETSVGGSLPRHILVTCEGWNHRPAIDDQTHLEQMMTWLSRKEMWELRLISIRKQTIQFSLIAISIFNFCLI